MNAVKSLLALFLLIVLFGGSNFAMGQSMQEQRACYNQARKVADKEVQWANHYDASSKTCWVEEWTNTYAPVVYSRWVFNAFESYSSVALFTGEIGKPPLVCFVEGAACRWGEEFDMMVGKKYGIKF